MYKILLSLAIFFLCMHDIHAQNVWIPVQPVQNTIVYQQQIVPYYVIQQPVIPIVYPPTVFVERRFLCEKRYIVYPPMVNYQYYYPYYPTFPLLR